jgi:hypothetical protein
MLTGRRNVRWIGKWTERWIHRLAARWKESQTGGQRCRQTYWTDGLKERLTDRQTFREQLDWTDKWRKQKVDRQLNRQVTRQVDRQIKSNLWWVFSLCFVQIHVGKCLPSLLYMLHHNTCTRMQYLKSLQTEKPSIFEKSLTYFIFYSFAVIDETRFLKIRPILQSKIVHCTVEN